MALFTSLYRTKIPKILIFASIVHLLFWLSFSPTTAMDAKNYFRMMLYGESNLIHAPGYPYVFHFIIPILSQFISFIFYDTTLPMLYAVTLIQHLFTIFTYVIFYKVLKKIFSTSVAVLSILLLTLNWTVLAFTNTIYPEWFQAKLLIIIFCFAFYAHNTKQYSKKFLLYTSCFVLFTITFLAKFNILIFICPLIIILIFEKLSRAKKFAIFISGFLFSFLFYNFFIITYHYPFTGTHKITLDKAWILSDQISKYLDGKIPDKKTGIYTKKLLLLSQILPSVKDRSESLMYDYPKVNIDPLQKYHSYDKHFEEIMSLSVLELDERLKSSDTSDSHVFYTSWVSISYHVGLEEANDLLVRVFFEVVSKHPVIVAKRVFIDSWNNLMHPYYYAVIPSDLYSMKQYNGVYGYNQSHMLWCNSNFVVLKPEKFGFFTLDLPCSFYERNIGNEFHNYIFLPFALPFSWFIDISNSIPPAFWTFVICSGLMISIKLRKTKNLPSSQFHLTILLTISSIFFIFFSNMIYLYRFDKEYQQVAPFISVLTSICMNIIYQFTKAGLRKMVSEKKLSS